MSEDLLASILRANMAMPLHLVEYPIPDGFDLVEGHARELYLCLKKLYEIMAGSVNLNNALAARLRYMESDHWDEMKKTAVTNLRTYYNEAVGILHQLLAVHVPLLPVPAPLDEDIAEILQLPRLATVGAPLPGAAGVLPQAHAPA